MLKNSFSLHNFRVSDEARKDDAGMRGIFSASGGSAFGMTRSPDAAVAEILELVQKREFLNVLP
jgi:hypothetical protein